MLGGAGGSLGVDSFCYLGDQVCSDGGRFESVVAGWVNFRDLTKG